MTRLDIQAGCRRAMCYCPVAIAVRRAMARLLRLPTELPNGVPTIWVGVTADELLVCARGIYAASHRVTNPTQVRQFVLDFDGGTSVYPFSFDLHVPLAGRAT